MVSVYLDHSGVVNINAAFCFCHCRVGNDGGCLLFCGKRSSVINFHLEIDELFFWTWTVVVIQLNNGNNNRNTGCKAASQEPHHINSATMCDWIFWSIG